MTEKKLKGFRIAEREKMEGEANIDGVLGLVSAIHEISPGLI